MAKRKKKPKPKPKEKEIDLFCPKCDGIFTVPVSQAFTAICPRCP